VSNVASLTDLNRMTINFTKTKEMLLGPLSRSSMQGLSIGNKGNPMGGIRPHRSPLTGQLNLLPRRTVTYLSIPLDLYLVLKRLSGFCSVPSVYNWGHSCLLPLPIRAMGIHQMHNDKACS